MAKKPSTRGKRKYRCEECGNEQFLHWVELNRRTRPHCAKCGSVRLEVVTKEAKEERDIGYRNVLEHDENRGDITLGSS